MENILSQAKRVAEEAEVFMVSAEETPVQFEANRLKHIQSKQSCYIALRIIKQGRVGYAITTRLDDRQTLVDAAVETAAFGTEAKFELPSLTSYPLVRIFDPDVESVPTEEMIDLGKQLIATVREYNQDIMCEAGVSRDIISTRIINSRGGKLDYKQTIFSLGIEGQLICGTDMLFVGESKSSCHPITDIKPITEVVLRQLELASRQAQLTTKPLPVIFTPNGVASALITPLMAAFNGKVVLQGASPIGDKLGQSIFDKKLYLSDNPTLDYCPESSPGDDEGTPSQRTPLIEQGTIANFIYDLQTAALANTRSTGNGSRSSGGVPAPSPSAFIIEPSNTTFKEMVSDIKEGLVVEYLMGAEQGNILSGDFSGNVLLGYKIENGEIVGRVKNTMLSGNIYRLLKQITAIGSDAKWAGNAIYTPSIYCPQVSVATK
ncbi:MAG: TldD/PmbA family protein [Dehalococcoidales bacterium]|nr:TldD/PmbA family protein [Dehalococcoidales bacterium]